MDFNGEAERLEFRDAFFLSDAQLLVEEFAFDELPFVAAVAEVVGHAVMHGAEVLQELELLRIVFFQEFAEPLVLSLNIRIEISLARDADVAAPPHLPTVFFEVAFELPFRDAVVRPSTLAARDVEVRHVHPNRARLVA